MALSGMLNIDETALICDFADEYGIYNYRNYDADYIAILATGLGPNSRIVKSVNGVQTNFSELLLARIYDQLNLLLWMQTEDGRKNRNMPVSLADMMLGRNDNKEIKGYETIEEFEIARQTILKGVA